MNCPRSSRQGKWERTKALITKNQEQGKVIHGICDCACISFSLHQSGYKPRQKPQLPLLEFRVSLQNIGYLHAATHQFLQFYLDYFFV